jgi:hypothetical protein
MAQPATPATRPAVRAIVAVLVIAMAGAPVVPVQGQK